MNSIYIYGASGHGLVVADVAKSCGYDNIIFVDDGDNKYPTFDDIKNLNTIPIALGIGINSTRAKLFEKVQNSDLDIVTLVHPNSVISSSVTIGKGTVVMPNVVVNVKATVGEGVILNTSCVVEHECILEDFVHISPNVALAGNVKVGKYTHIGIGSSVIQNIKIGHNTVVGSGSIVVKNINNFKKAYGNPCREIEDIN
jgi:UDP-N-acetylbacillosamine N-acetyltransferase